MALKTFFNKLFDFIIMIFEKISGFFKKIFASKLFKRVGSLFRDIPSKTSLISVFLRKISNFPPLSWFKKFTLPVWRFVSKYLSIALNFFIELLGKLHLGRVKSAVESLQIFFQPEYITGLTFNSRFISAVRVANSFKGTVIDHTALSAVKNPDKMTWELIEFARKENLEEDILITCLPTSKATIRQIPIPIDNVKKLSRIIKYQMEPYVPFTIDEMVIDFLPSNKSDKVLTAGVENQILTEHIEGLAQAGLEPQTVSLDDIALMSLFHHASGIDSSLLNAVFHFTEEKTTVMIIKENQLMFIRMLAPIKDNYEPIIETLNLFQLENPDEKLNHILITGCQGVDDTLAKTIKSKLDLAVSVWKPFDHLKHNLGKLDADTQSRMSVSLGLALSCSNSKGKIFDLRKESFAIKKFLTLKKFFFYAAYAALVFLFLFTFSTYQKLFVYKKKNIRLQEDMQQLYVNAFPDAKPVKGQELAQMKQKVDEEARYKVLDSLGNGNTVLSTLAILTQLFSEFQGLIIHQLSIEAGDIKLYVSASSFENVDRIKQALENSQVFQSVKLLDAKMDKKDNTVRFNIALEKSR